jgi:riboflavin kinase/FMN adenylyltransferase
MIVVRGLEAFPNPARPAAVALGTFDGMHRGHRAVIEALRAAAQRVAGQAVAVTFEPHPIMVIAPPGEAFLLTTLEERIALFEATGVDAVVVVEFDEAVRQISADAWLARLEATVAPRAIVASSTHTFGRNREGTPERLQRWASSRGVEAVVVPPVENGGVVISSSAIRDRLRAGDVRTAAEWLGRWYAVRGEVVRGEGRGRMIGVPTANLAVPPLKLVPARGVYAAYARVDGQTFAAAVNVGVRPTFGAAGLCVEAHLLDVDTDLYGRVLELAFVARLRDERRFPSMEALRDQLSEDLRMTRKKLDLMNYVDPL